MVVVDRVLDWFFGRLALEIAIHLAEFNETTPDVETSPEPFDDRYTDYERALMMKRAQNG